MKKSFLLSFGILIFFFNTSFAQTSNSDSISIKKVLGGYQFSQNGQIFKMRDLKRALIKNQEAYYQFEDAQPNYIATCIFSFTGGFLIGYPIGVAIRGDKANWAMAGIGAGLIGLSIPFTIKLNKQLKSAVETYNHNLKNGTKAQNIELKLNISSNALGFKLIF